MQKKLLHRNQKQNLKIISLPFWLCARKIKIALASKKKQ